MSDEKVVFLDIDGPMIPATCFLYDRMASYERRFPPTTLAVIKAVCERTGAKIVFNTTHNISFPEVDDICVALVKQGLPAEYLHQDHHTRYPELDRDLAVKEWLGRHPTEAWIAFDDVHFTKDERLIFIDSDAGLHIGHLNIAVEKLGGKPFIVLI